jgi:pSer/pThr/pTyr-binding forkhead associated (FHA) protein
MSSESATDLPSYEEMEGVTVAVFLDEEEEALISEPVVSQPTAHLINTKTKEKVVINKPQFTVGRQSDSVDYGIKGSNAISRIHAVILSQGGRYYLIDLNSSNKTYINDKEIAANIEKEIGPGTRVRFADVEFVFGIS